MDGGDALPQRFEIAALRSVGSAGGDDGQAAPCQSSGERAPALARPLLVAKRRRGMDHRIGTRRNVCAGGRCGTNQFGHARNAERVGKAQHLLDAMDVRHRRRAAIKDAGFDDVPEPGPVRVGQPGMGSSGEHGEECRAVARLGRNREVVALEQACHERERLGRCRPLRRADDMIDIGIAVDDAGRPRKCQHVDRGVGPGPPQAANERRGQQRVADAPQRYDQNAWLGRERDRRVRGCAHRRPGIYTGVSVNRWRSEASSFSRSPLS